MIRQEQYQQKNIKKDIRLLSRYIGLKWARYIISALLIAGFYYFKLTALYLLFVTLLLPECFKFLLSYKKKDKKNRPSSLKMTLKKYNFTLDKYNCEKYSQPLILILLFAWQVNLKGHSLPLPWQIYPAILFVTNVLARIIISPLFHLHLHRNFLNLNIDE